MVLHYCWKQRLFDPVFRILSGVGDFLVSEQVVF